MVGLREVFEDRIEVPVEATAGRRVFPAVRSQQKRAHLDCVELAELVGKRVLTEHDTSIVLDADAGLLHLGERARSTRVDGHEDGNLVHTIRDERAIDRDDLIDRRPDARTRIAAMMQRPARRHERPLVTDLAGRGRAVGEKQGGIECGEHLVERVDLGAIAVIRGEKRMTVEVFRRIPIELDGKPRRLGEFQLELRDRFAVLLLIQLQSHVVSPSSSPRRTMADALRAAPSGLG